MTQNLNKLLQKAYEEHKAAYRLPPEKVEFMSKDIFDKASAEKKSEGKV